MHTLANAKTSAVLDELGLLEQTAVLVPVSNRHVCLEP
jgi:hypothetical protein